MKEYAIIVAGGSGSRMQQELPKQFILLGGQPILMHTLRRFADYSSGIKLILVLPKDHWQYWESLCRQYQFELPYQLCAGGRTRAESVSNGLECIQEPNKSLVAIHDGVRPFVSSSIIAESFKVAKAKGNAVACVALKDSVRRVFSPEKNQAEDRQSLRLVQTPQTFWANEIIAAYAKLSQLDNTDEASALEKMGRTIHLIEGDYRNIKITTPEDLIIAEAFFRAAQQEQTNKGE